MKDETIALGRELSVLARTGVVRVVKTPRPLRAVAHALLAWEYSGRPALPLEGVCADSLTLSALTLPEGDLVRESLLAAATALRYRDGLGRGEDGLVRLAFLEARAVVAAMAFVVLHQHVPDRFFDLRPVVLAYVHEHVERLDVPCPEAYITALLSRGHGLTLVECTAILEALCERGMLVSVKRPRRRGVFYRTVE